MKLEQRIAQLERRKSRISVAAFVGQVDGLVHALTCTELVTDEQFRAYLQQAVSHNQEAAR